MDKLANSNYLKHHQYKDDANLNARIRLHRQFSTNKYSWFRWVFEHLNLPQTCRILELGCGPGDLWAENADRLPKGWEVTLSDFSPGMVEHARQKVLPLSHEFDLRIIAAQEIPYPAESFHAVIANHMLYHVPDREKTLSEIHRILKPGGRAYFATGGENHMSELPALVAKFDPLLAANHQAEKVDFTLENGTAQLGQWFSSVTLYRQENALRVTEVEPLVDYVLSSLKLGVEIERKDEFAYFVEKELASNDGELLINKENGMFEALKKRGVRTGHR